MEDISPVMALVHDLLRCVPSVCGLHVGSKRSGWKPFPSSQFLLSPPNSHVHSTMEKYKTDARFWRSLKITVTLVWDFPYTLCLSCPHLHQHVCFQDGCWEIHKVTYESKSALFATHSEKKVSVSFSAFLWLHCIAVTTKI